MLNSVPVRNVRRADVLIRFCLSPSGLHKNLRLGRFPQPFHVGGKPLWREADLAAVEAGLWKPEHREGSEPATLSSYGDTADNAPPLKVGRPRGSKSKPNL